MRHCVASYAKDAVEGHRYLFHVAHAGPEATVEVDRFGRVVQSHGLGNGYDEAVAWGRRTLERWRRRRPSSKRTRKGPARTERSWNSMICRFEPCVCPLNSHLCVSRLVNRPPIRQWSTAGGFMASKEQKMIKCFEKICRWRGMSKR